MKQNRKHRAFQNLKIGLLLISALVLGLKVFAGEEEAESIAPRKVVFFETFDLKERRGHMNVLVHLDGHSNGRGYVIELRPDCNARPRSYKEVQLRDMEAQCYIDVKTVKFDADKDSVTFDGYEMDYDLHEKNMQKDPPETSISCDLKNKKTFVLRTGNFCLKKKKK